MSSIGIKLADGSFYKIMEEGSAQTKNLELTTANNDQTCVMVDLYRSSTDSMEDAEYIDSLKINNMNKHPNGEPNLSLTISLDEENKLSANIIDPETGANSDSSISLISRTVEERLPFSDVVSIFNSDNEEDITQEQTVTDATIVNDDFTNDIISDDIISEDLPDFAEASLTQEPEVTEEISDDLPEFTQDNIEDTIPEFEDLTENPEETLETDQTQQLSMDNTNFELPIPEESVLEETNFADLENMNAEDLPDISITKDTEDSSEPQTYNLDFASLTPASPEDNSNEEDIFANLDEVNITEEELNNAEDILYNDKAIEETETPNDDIQELNKDIQEDIEIPQENSEEALADFDIPQNVSEDLSLQAEPGEDIFTNESELNQGTPASSNDGRISFTGLYDKETVLGESSNHEEDTTKKKTKIPMLICIICAAICILATIIILFFIPSKYNLITKKAANTTQTEQTQVAKKDKKTEAPMAKDNEVIVVEKAETVKPVALKKNKTKNVQYKIKWGDTLWDIAGTFYKNPWAFRKIAAANNIQNPDHIISGTTIIIPAD